jgi:hypothetical protein
MKQLVLPFHKLGFKIPDETMEARRRTAARNRYRSRVGIPKEAAIWSIVRGRKVEKSKYSAP